METTHECYLYSLSIDPGGGEADGGSDGGEEGEEGDEMKLVNTTEPPIVLMT